MDLRERILASHKDQTALELIRQAGAEVRLFLSYSPDLNPIEKMWSKIKTGSVLKVLQKERVMVFPV